MSHPLYWVALQTALGVPCRNFSALLSVFGTPEKVFEATEQELKQSGVLSPKQIRSILEKPYEKSKEIYYDCKQAGIDIYTPEHPLYPNGLRHIEDMPCVLYGKGRLPALDAKLAIGVVGSRKPTAYGALVARRIAGVLGVAGAVVVSGGALGIDGAAHMGALSEKGATVAVLGCGFLAKYRDSYAALKDEIIENGVVFTEYPPRTPAVGRHFPVRNRIISALSYGVVVVEGALGSGSLITAQMAIDQGRELFAVPGDAINSQHSGTIELIRKGATPVFSCADIMAVYEFVYPDIVDYEKIERTPLYENQFPMDFSKVTYGVTSVYSQETVPDEVMKEVIEDRLQREENEKAAQKLNGNDKTVYDALTSEPVHIDDIMRKLTSLTPAKVMVSLTKLEMENLVVSDNGKKYRRK